MNKPRTLLIVLCVVALLLDFAHLRHGDRVPESWWGFYGIFAFCCCIALAIIASWLRKLLSRPPGYYQDHGLDNHKSHDNE